MEYIYSALLLHKAGKQIVEENVSKVLEAAGVSVDNAKVKALIASLEGVDIEKAIESQMAMQTVSSPQQTHEHKKEEKKEAKKPEEEKKLEEDAAAGLSALFG
ncbi:MAG: 50S ribosomal protein P1 [Nanoarchaeota archaeon]